MELSGSALIFDIKPLAFILRLYGLFPANVSKNHIIFSYYSPLAILSLFHVVVCWSIPFIRLLLVMEATITRKGQLILYGLQLFLKGLPATMTFGTIVCLVDSLKKTDKLLTRTPKTTRRMFWPTLSLFIYSTYLLIALCLAFDGSLSSFLTRPLVALIWHREPQQTVLFAFFAHQLGARFQIVREMVGRPEQGRLAHAALSTCLRLFSQAFELRMFITILAIGTDYLFNVFMNTYHKGDETNSLSWVFGVLDGMAAIYFPARVATMLIQRVYEVEDDLINMSLTDKSDEFCRQIELFLEEVRTSNLEVTAWGVFRLDSGLYGSFVNTLLTFFIAMAQFSNEITNIMNRYGLDN